MLAAAERSVDILGLKRRDAAVRFLQSRHTADGGFADRAGKSDLYYTVFGVEALAALKSRDSHYFSPAQGGRSGEESSDCPDFSASLRRHLTTYGAGDGLDFVHLACLARAWAGLGEDCPDAGEILRRIELHHCADGGYSQSPAGGTGTAYGCFLALAAYQDLGAALPDPAGVAASLEALVRPDGGFANDRDLPIGLTPATAAAVTALVELGRPVPSSAAGWLFARQSPQGGFLAMPEAPIPDLLSTATALHALARVASPGAPGAVDSALPPADAARMRDFVLGLLTDSGGFAGSAADPTPDCEYTYYGLIALGHLAR